MNKRLADSGCGFFKCENPSDIKKQLCFISFEFKEEHETVRESNDYEWCYAKPNDT